MRPDIEHKSLGPRQVRCFVLTVSDTRTEATDTGGRATADLLTAAGHLLTGRAIVKDEPQAIREAIVRQIGSGDSDVVITTGGTGITSRDGTLEVVRALLNKELTGFGELFRMLSYHEIGPAAMMSRATAGLAGRCVVVALPGSEAAVRLAMEKLLIPELGHLVQQASR
ncbi:MAG: MogA/MoaB family molybdenum cofactor biosynthesis protein [Acidimicrobiia bacterium]|nr:MogA/MoaB family molybdenum cofactor biosynthesis protein [Acidimicrobiia bacterium]